VNPTQASALELAQALRARELSSVELVDAFLDRISKLDPTINAFTHVAADEARRDAAEADRRLATGDDAAPFLGVPIAVKDLSNVAGMPTSMGVFRDPPDAAADDHVPALLRAAGFVILGKTNVPPLGLMCTTELGPAGPCHNPWVSDRTTGGSSGGAAAAVAAGLTPVAQGSDGGGSIRIPASACGVFTIKPTRGRVSHAPAPSSLTSTSGPITWTVADAAALLDVMSVPGPGDGFVAPAPPEPFAVAAARSPRRCRVAVTSADADGGPVAPASRAAVDRTAALLADLGHEVEEAAPPGWTSSALIDLVLDLAGASVAATADQLPVDALDPLTRGYLEHGRTVSGGAVLRAQAEVNSWSRRWAPFFAEYDVLLTPQNATSPPPLGWLVEDPTPRAVLERSWTFAPFTAQWNFAGNPAVTIPVDTDDLGLPVGLQVAAHAGEDDRLLAVAAAIEGVLQ